MSNSAIAVYEQREILIQALDEGQEVSLSVQANVALDTGLAYHPDTKAPDVYRVTHLATGLAVPVRLRDEKEARRLIEILVMFFDLEETMPAVRADLDKERFWQLIALVVQGTVARIREVNFIESVRRVGVR